VTALLYDHVLTLGEEITLIWLNPAAGLGYRIIFIVDRYLTEAVSLYAAYSKSPFFFLCYILTPCFYCRTFLWVLAITTTIFTSLSNFVLAMRVYTLWDHRRAIKWLLMCTFGAALPASLVFSILSAQEIQSFAAYNPFIRTCVITEKPWALPFVLAIWVFFDFFIILLTLYNAMERPHRNQAEVMTSMQHDGAKMFVVISITRFEATHADICAQSVLRLVNLTVAIVGDATYCFVTFTLLWAMLSVVTSRMQLRVERLRFTRFGGDLLPLNFMQL
ncbi:hypothetical protein C8R44DRAFT_932190, partial [Mycena epipterygia]